VAPAIAAESSTAEAVFPIPWNLATVTTSRGTTEQRLG
jgi:hypothetical protein